jgi:hypothetical protein
MIAVAAGFWLGFFVLANLDRIGLLVWGDQLGIWLQAPRNFGNPYVLPSFVSPPYISIFLLPLTALPPLLAILIQLCLTTVVLALLVYKHGGNWRTLLLVVSCYIMFHVTIELNVDWLVMIGLLVPPAWSAPFLATKPQLAYGVVLSYSRRDFVRFVIVGLILLIVSLLIWNQWPLQMLEATRRVISTAQWNTALIGLLTPFVAIPVGLLLAWRGFRRRDPVLCTLAGFFFVPYTGFYSHILSFTLVALRFPRVALLISIILWGIFAPILIGYISRGL